MRSRTVIERRIELTQQRLDDYLTKEHDILAGGVQSYGIGSRNLARYNADLATIRAAIKELEQELAELESELAGGGRRKAVGIVYRDW